jgi:hypothetical protein
MCRCRMPQHAATTLAAIPWPSACRHGTRTALPVGSCAHASPRPPPSPPCVVWLSHPRAPACPFCHVAHAFPPRGASAQPPPPTWHGQPPRAKVRSFASRHGRYHRARVTSLPSMRARLLCRHTEPSPRSLPPRAGHVTSMQYTAIKGGHLCISSTTAPCPPPVSRRHRITSVFFPPLRRCQATSRHLSPCV